MITRIVKLTFSPEHIEDFKSFYSNVNSTIEEMPGCLRVSLMKDSKFDNIMFTVSNWESEDALNLYRQTDFFKSTWARTKTMFCANPEAYTLYQIAE